MTSSPRRTRCVIRAGGLAALLVLATACGGQSATVDSDSGGTRADPGSLSIALVPGWDEDVAVTYLWKAVLEERGYEVDVREAEIAATFAGVAGGRTDLYFDAWLPTTHQSYWDELGEDLEIVGIWYAPARNNLTVPEALTEVNTIADLAEHAAEFDNRIVGIEAGAGLMRLTREEVMPVYGLDGFELTENSSAAMLAELQAAVEANEPIVVPLWEPHWAYAAMSLKVLEDPEGAFGEPDEIDIVATRGFSEEQPEVAEWLGRFGLTADELGTLQLLIREMGEGNEQEAAEEWIADNEALVNSWTG